MFLSLLLFFALAEEPADDTVRISVGKSALIELTTPARAVSVTDETTVLPRKLSPTMWMLQGRRIGATDVVIVHGDGRVEVLDLEVQRDVSELQRAVGRIVAE